MGCPRHRKVDSLPLEGLRHPGHVEILAQSCPTMGREVRHLLSAVSPLSPTFAVSLSYIGSDSYPSPELSLIPLEGPPWHPGLGTIPGPLQVYGRIQRVAFPESSGNHLCLSPMPQPGLPGYDLFLGPGRLSLSSLQGWFGFVVVLFCFLFKFFGSIEGFQGERLAYS